MSSLKRSQTIAAALLLTLLSLVVFGRTVFFDFVYFDDDVYVTHNPEVISGLTLHGLRWAFTTVHAGFWQPLTWLSLMLDAQIFGLNAGGFHGTNVALHVANTVLLFIVVKALTGAFARSLAVAALFAVHPIHVESVAWVTERRDLLFTTFGLVAVGAYLRYVRRPSLGAMVFIVLAQTGSLMAKQMLVTLPFLLLVLDFWPLGRLATSRNPRTGQRTLVALVVEKIPLFCLSAVFSVAAFWAQRAWGAMSGFDTVSIATRVGNASVAYGGYLAKSVFPTRLSAIYVLPDAGHPWPLIGISLGVLTGISVAILLLRLPPLTVGWLWFLGTLVPVIGVVQIGLQFMADRFMYVPLIGLLLAVVWPVADLFQRWRRGRMAGRMLAAAVTTILLVLASARTTVWKDSASLFGAALAVDPKNWLAHYFLGLAQLDKHRYAEAAEHFYESLRIHPNFRRSRNNLGMALMGLNRPEDAIVQFRLALLRKAEDSHTHANLGQALAKTGRTGEAIMHLREAVRLDPANIKARNNLGSVLAQEGKVEEARVHFKEALRLSPDYATARANLERLERNARQQ